MYISLFNSLVIISSLHLTPHFANIVNRQLETWFSPDSSGILSQTIAMRILVSADIEIIGISLNMIVSMLGQGICKQIAESAPTMIPRSKILAIDSCKITVLSLQYSS